MDEIKSWELACRLVEKEFPSQKGRVYSILAVSAMLAAGKIAFPGMVTDIVSLDNCQEQGLGRKDRASQLKILIAPDK